jgi:hypothetical protein
MAAVGEAAISGGSAGGGPSHTAPNPPIPALLPGDSNRVAPGDHPGGAIDGGPARLAQSSTMCCRCRFCSTGPCRLSNGETFNLPPTRAVTLGSRRGSSHKVDAGSRPESAEYEAAPSVARSSKSLDGFRRRAAQNLPQICAKVESPILWTLWK